MDVWLAFGDNGFYILYEFFRGRPLLSKEITP